MGTKKSVYSFYKMSMNKELTGMYPEISVLPLQDVHEQGTHRYVSKNQCTPFTICL